MAVLVRVALGRHTTLVPMDVHGSGPESPKRLIVVRHGATEWSVSGRHTGRTDLPLTESGQEEARSLRDRLLKFSPVLVFTSPLRRALDTCRLAGLGERAIVDERLVEWDYGEYEGLTFGEIQDQNPDWKLFDDGAPEGESVADVGARADSFLASLTGYEELEGGEALVFAHGHLLRMVAARWLGLQPGQSRYFELDSSGIGVLGWKHSEPTLEHWNV
jgi:broad specificity phosphatase PhoE